MIGQAGVYWPFKTLLQGSGITIQEDATTIRIGATGGGSGGGGGDMTSAEYATNGVFGIVDKAVVAEGLTPGAVVPQAVLAQQVPWTGITGIPSGFIPTPHAPTHLPGGTDTIAAASATSGGLMAQLSGNTTDFVDGTNHCQPIVAAVRPIISDVRLRTLNTIGNPTFECNQQGRAAAAVIVGGTKVADRWYASRTSGINASVIVGQSPVTTPGPAFAPGTNFRLSQNALLIQVGTQQTLAVNAADIFGITHWTESMDWLRLSGDVHSFSLIAWTNVIGGLRFGMTLRDSASTWSLPKLCTIPAPEVWSLIQLPNLPKWPSTGNFGNGATNAIGYNVFFSFCAGSNWIAPSADVWQSGNFAAPPGIDNLLTKPVGAQVFIGFVQHEPLSTCSQFMDVRFGDNLFACKRFYTKSTPYGVAPVTGGYAVARGHAVAGSTTVRSHAIFERELFRAPTSTRIWWGTVQNNVYLDGTGIVAVTSAPQNVNQKFVTDFLINYNIASNYPVLFEYDADTGM